MNIEPYKALMEPMTAVRRGSLVLIALAIVGSALAQTKWEYYNNVLAPQRGLKPLPKASTAADRKRSVLNVGNVWARISNAAVLGYDRWGLCYEFPAKSGFTYRWTMAPLIGAKKKNGTKYVASGTRGAARFSEEEFQPVKGFDAGIEDERNNIGIAFSDIPASWPAAWPNTRPLSELPANARKLTNIGLSYNQPSVGPGGFPGVVNGNVRAVREAYFVVTDNDESEGNKPAPMDIRVDMWALQWDDILNQNFIVYKMLLTNVGTDTLYDVYIGIHDDPDCPEQGAAEWTDDFAAFISPGSDVPGYDARNDSLLWNFTYLWDGDDKVEGLIAKNVGWVGLKFLETPNDPATGRPRGVTTFQVFEYAAAPQSEGTEYDQLAAGIMPPNNSSPHSRDWTQTPNTYGPDVTYVVASGPFMLPPGGQLNFAFATIHAANKSDLFNNAILCQLLYNAQYQAAEPPPEPKVNTAVGDREVVLYWDDRSEKGVYYKSDGTVDHTNDRLTRTNAFQGYMIFKSTDRGITWGERITDVRGGFKYWKPLAQYDVIDGVTGESTHDLGRYFWLGDDTGLRHTFVDRNVSNGYEYWYAVCAYDGNDGAIPPLLNSIKADRQQLGGNTVAVVPAAPSKGMTVGAKQNDPMLTSGRTTVRPLLTVLNPYAVTGKEYAINVAVNGPYDKTFTVTDFATGDTIVGIGPNAAASKLANVPLYREEMDNLAVFDGLKLLVQDHPKGVLEGRQTFPAGDRRIKLDSWSFIFEDSTGSGMEDDFEIIFADTSAQDTLWSWCARRSAPNVLYKVPLYIRNVTTGNRVIPLVEDGGDKLFNIDAGDALTICNATYDTVTTIKLPGGPPFPPPGLKAPIQTYNYTLTFTTDSKPKAGDKFAVYTKHQLRDGDAYKFGTIKQSTSTMTSSNMEVQAVPNPYVVSSYFETMKFGLNKEIQFHHLPPKCTIRIFNLAGDLIRTIIHDATRSATPTIARWDLQSYNGQEVAFGVYIFHVDAPGIGEYVGKLALIK